MAVVAVPRRRVSPATLRNTLVGLAFCLPWIVGLLAFRAYPIGAAFWYSLTDYQGMNPPEFIGFANYGALTRDSELGNAARNTAEYTLMAIPAAIYAIETTHIPVYLPAYDELEKNKAKFDPRWQKFWPLKEVARFRPNLPVGQELWNAQSTASDLARHLKEEPAAVLKRLNTEVNEAYKKYK